MMALEFGEPKLAMPTPEIIMATTIIYSGVLTVSRENRNIATVEQTIPNTAGHRVPTLSDNRPETGPRIAIAMDVGTIMRAALEGESCKPCIR